MCDRIMPRSQRPCQRPSSSRLTVGVTGDVVELCDICAHLYEQGIDITYAKKPDAEPWPFAWGEWRSRG
jgi:hypothetical protein